MNSRPRESSDESSTKMKSHGTNDEDAQQDVRSLLVVPSIDIPPHERVQSPAQLKFPLYDYQRVCLTWLIRQEQDDKKMGSILAGEHHLTFSPA